MPHIVSTDRELAWNLLLAAARHAETAAHDESGSGAAFALGSDGALRQVPAGDPDAVLAWQQDVGWTARLAPNDPQLALIDLYLPVCSATASHPLTIGHLGQSLDG